jgi:predicted acyltransferase
MPELAQKPVTRGEPATAFTTPRLMSVDALRGFDMFWIIGADALVYALKRIADGLQGQATPDNGSLLYRFIKLLAEQLDHCAWAGFHFYDMIFPLFVFIMGVSLVFSLTKQLQKGGRADALKRLSRRFILLFIVALLYSGGFSNPWPDIRLLGVLNRIALCYLFGALIFIFFKPRAIAAIAVALLVGYWAMMNFVPIRNIQLESGKLAERAAAAGNEKLAAQFRQGKGVYENEGGKNFSTIKNSEPMIAAREMFNQTTETTTGKFDPGLNVANHFDFQYLPGKKWDVYWDPEGILSTLPAIVSCLLGVFAGLLLRSADYCDKWKLIYLFSFGVAGVLLGFLWGMQFPVVKKIWSSSFVLVAGGYSAILLGAFYWIVDVKKWRGWCQPFVWMGMNSITIYLTSNAIGGFRGLAKRFVGGDVRTFFETHLKGGGDLVIALAGLALAFWFVHFLYRRKIFLRF